MPRPPTGPALVDSLAGSDTARERTRLILETIAGTTSVVDAAAKLGISPQRFHDLRSEVLAATVAACEPKPLGRPRSDAANDPAAAALAERDRRIGDLEVELELQRLRIELDAAGLTRGARARTQARKKTPLAPIRLPPRQR